MPNYYASLTMAMTLSRVPKKLKSLEDLTPLFKPGEALDTYSRRNWLSLAFERCATHYGFGRLSYLSQSAAVLNPPDVQIAAREIANLLVAIEANLHAFAALFGLDDGLIAELEAALQAPASPWGPLPHSDDGDELHYLISALKAHMALLNHADNNGLCVVHAQTE